MIAVGGGGGPVDVAMAAWKSRRRRCEKGPPTARVGVSLPLSSALDVPKLRASCNALIWGCVRGFEEIGW